MGYCIIDHLFHLCSGYVRFAGRVLRIVHDIIRHCDEEQFEPSIRFTNLSFLLALGNISAVRFGLSNFTVLIGRMG